MSRMITTRQGDGNRVVPVGARTRQIPGLAEGVSEDHVLEPVRRNSGPADDLPGLERLTAESGKGYVVGGERLQRHGAASVQAPKRRFHLLDQIVDLLLVASGLGASLQPVGNDRGST